MTPEEIDSFRQAALPLMEWLRDNMHPHATVIVDSDRAELVEGLAIARCRERFDDKEEAK